MSKPFLLLYRIDGRLQQESGEILAGHYLLQSAPNLTAAHFHLTHEHIACIVAGLSHLNSSLIGEIFCFRSCFQTVPIVVYGIPHAPETFEGGWVDGPLRCIPRGSFDRMVEEFPKAGLGSLRLFDVLGREVRRFDHQVASSGYMEFFWDGRSETSEALPNGVYFYAIGEGHSLVQRRKMIKLK